jgi:hypothetical protein
MQPKRPELNLENPPDIESRVLFIIALCIVIFIAWLLYSMSMWQGEDGPALDDTITVAAVHQESRAVALCAGDELRVQFLNGQREVQHQLPGNCLHMDFSRKGDILWVISSDGILTTLSLPSGAVLGELVVPIDTTKVTE